MLSSAVWRWQQGHIVLLLRVFAPRPLRPPRFSVIAGKNKPQTAHGTRSYGFAADLMCVACQFASLAGGTGTITVARSTPVLPVFC